MRTAFGLAFDRIFDRVFLNLDAGAGSGGGSSGAPGAGAGGSGSSAGVAPGVSAPAGGSSPAGPSSPAAAPSPSVPTPAPAGAAPGAPAQPGFGAGDSPASGGVPGLGGAPAGPAPYTPPSQEQWAQHQRQLAEMQALQQQMAPLAQMGWHLYQQQQQQQQRQQPAQPAGGGQPAWNNPFGLPQFDQAYYNFVRRDPQTGDIVPVIGAPPDAVARYQDYAERLRNVQHEFWQQPQKFLQPLIQEQAQKIAREVVQQHFGQYQQQQTVQQIVAQNRDWMYQTDPATGTIRTQYNVLTGQTTPVYTAPGQFYVNAVQQATRMGITDPNAQHQFAIAQVQNAVMQQRLQQLQAPAAGQQQQQQFLQQAAQGGAGHAQPQPGSFAPAAAVPGQPAPTAQTLEDMLRNQFQADGYMSNPALLEAQMFRQSQPNPPTVAG